MLRQRVDLAVLDDLDDLALDRLADPLQLLRALPSSASWAIEPAGLADPGRGAPVGEHAERVVALDLEDVGEQLELGGDVRVRGQGRRHRAMIRRRARDASACRPTTSARTSSDADLLPRPPRVPVEADRLEPIDRLSDERRLTAGSPSVRSAKGST